MYGYFACGLSVYHMKRSKEGIGHPGATTGFLELQSFRRILSHFSSSSFHNFEWTYVTVSPNIFPGVGWLGNLSSTVVWIWRSAKPFSKTASTCLNDCPWLFQYRNHVLGILDNPVIPKVSYCSNPVGMFECYYTNCRPCSKHLLIFQFTSSLILCPGACQLFSITKMDLYKMKRH